MKEEEEQNKIEKWLDSCIEELTNEFSYLVTCGVKKEDLSIFLLSQLKEQMKNSPVKDASDVQEIKKKTKQSMDSKITEAIGNGNAFLKIVSRYLEEELPCELLSFEERLEIEKYLSHVKTHPWFSYEEERRLLEEAQKGNLESLEKLLFANQFLVAAVAKKNIGRGLDFQDLVQEGNIGLINAIRHFDFTKGDYRFLMYGYQSIRNMIGKAIHADGKLISVAQNLQISFRSWEKTFDKMTQRLGREPSLEEFAEEIGWKESRLQVIRALENIESLDALLKEEESIQKIEESLILEEPSVEDYAIEKDFRKKILLLLEHGELTEREEEIICSQYELRGKEKKTFAELALLYSLSPERIKQLAGIGLRRIRRLEEVKEFLIYLDEPTKSWNRVLWNINEPRTRLCDPPEEKRRQVPYQSPQTLLYERAKEKSIEEEKVEFPEFYRSLIRNEDNTVKHIPISLGPRERILQKKK